MDPNTRCKYRIRGTKLKLKYLVSFLRVRINLLIIINEDENERDKFFELWKKIILI